MSCWKEMDRPLYPGASNTVAETVLLVMNYVLKNGITWVGMEELFSVFNVALGCQMLPETKFLINKLFGGMNDGFTFHLYCVDCQSYLGKHLRKVHAGETMECDVCRKSINVQKQIKLGNYFVTLPIAKQLKMMLRDNSLCEVLATRLLEINRSSIEEVTVMKDITDGLLYREMRTRLQCTPDDLTITFSTDGGARFKSSNTSIWPIQFVVNELPPDLRWSNVILTGLWYGKSHPNMRIFIDAFVQEMIPLSITPIKWSSGNAEHNSRLFSICACVDSPARALIMNTTQFNGRYGCSWCLHPGITMEGTSQLRYTVLEHNVENRTAAGLENDMREAFQQHQIVRGVKGPSPLVNLPGFDVVWGLSPEYMHSVFLGVVNQITEIWFSEVDLPCYIGSPSNRRNIDNRLLKIKTPHIITRLPRSIDSRKLWKANEWRNWLLYYSFPCLLGILPDRFLHHWNLLIEAVYLTMKDEISRADINKMESLFVEFVVRTEQLYGKSEMTSNVHQLLHHAKAVKMLGPAWSRSAFVFEGNMRTLLQNINAARGVVMQIMNRYMFKKILQSYVNGAMDNIKEEVCMAIKGLNEYSHVKNCTEIHTCKATMYMMGKARGTARQLSNAEKVACENMENVCVYDRMLIKNMRIHSMYHSKIYSKPEKMDNTVVRSSDGKYLRILKFITYTDVNNVVRGLILGGAIVQELIISGTAANVLCHIHKCDYPPTDHNVQFICADDIHRICVIVNHPATKYVCDIPNVFERD